MLGLDTLDVAIGLVFVYLLVSFVCSAAAEVVELLVKQRGKLLLKGINELVKKDADALYAHPLIKSLYKDNDLPSYIPARNFALAVLNLADNPPTGATDLQKIETAIQGLGQSNSHLYKALSAIFLSAEGKAENVIKGIEDWYNGTMDRVAGWYKRYAQAWLLLFGIIVAVAMNVDTITIVKYLSVNKTKRDAIVASASSVVQKGLERQTKPVTIKEGVDDIVKSVDNVKSLGLPIGWNNLPPDGDGAWCWCWQHILGWLLTAIAVSFGAPFWFDVLNKFMVVRSTVKPKEKSGNEKSKDAK